MSERRLRQRNVISYPEEAFDRRCEECGSFMKLKRSHVYNQLFYGCESWPACQNAFSASNTGRPLPGVDNRPKPKEPKPNLPESFACRCGGGNQILRWSHLKKRYFYGCETYPKCDICLPLTHIEIDRWCLLTRPEEEGEPQQPSSKARQRARRNARRFKDMLDEF